MHRFTLPEHTLVGLKSRKRTTDSPESLSKRNHNGFLEAWYADAGLSVPGSLTLEKNVSIVIPKSRWCIYRDGDTCTMRWDGSRWSHEMRCGRWLRLKCYATVATTTAPSVPSDDVSPVTTYCKSAFDSLRNHECDVCRASCDPSMMTERIRKSVAFDAKRAEALRILETLAARSPSDPNVARLAEILTDLS